MEKPLLVSLVGESPIPVLLGCRDLGGSGVRHLLVHSETTHSIAKHIADSIERLGAQAECLPLTDPNDPRDVIGSLTEWLGQNHPGEIRLHFTGGTKAMVAGAIIALSQTSRPSDLWYLDHLSHSYRPLEGSKRPGSELSSISETTRLHGWVMQEEEPFCRPDWEVLTQRFMEWTPDIQGRRTVLSDEARYGKFHTVISDLASNVKRRSLVETRWESVRQFAVQLPILVRSHFGCEIRSDWEGEAAASLRDAPDLRSPVVNDLSQAAAFLQGCWLEELVRQGLARALGPEASRVSGPCLLRPIHSRRSARGSEVDAIFLADRGLVFISVTKSWNQASVREKMNEVQNVSGKVAGPLALRRVVAPVTQDVADRLGEPRTKVLGWEFLDALANDWHDVVLTMAELGPP
jgi:hypothetical protein